MDHIDKNMNPTDNEQGKLLQLTLKKNQNRGLKSLCRYAYNRYNTHLHPLNPLNKILPSQNKIQNK